VSSLQGGVRRHAPPWMARIASPIVAAGDAFELGADAEPFRAEARAFLAEHAPDGRFPTDFPHRLAAAGLVAPHWPRPWGLDAGPLQQLAVDAELRAAKAPRPFNPIGIGWAGPTLLVAGTPAQQQRWIPGILDGTEIWCQLFSEPGAGSDLAALSTRATRDGDEWIVNGQKVWTTFAHLARWGILLARTDPNAEAHHGISYFVVDMRSPGITVQPIRQMDGNADFNEVFLDEVRVPAAALVGTEHDGWRLAKVTLGNERVSLSGEGALWGQGPTADEVLDLVRAHGGTEDAVLRQRLAALHVEAQVLRLIRLRTLSARVRGLEPGPEASVRKALSDEHGQHVMALALELAGTDALLADRGPFGTDTRLWVDGYLYSRALTIGGGTSEVQRNIIAERVLGLPRDTEPT
jgi:alkylation response protein AidB-like acyl-CoA dehydrogenase